MDAFRWILVSALMAAAVPDAGPADKVSRNPIRPKADGEAPTAPEDFRIVEGVLYNIQRSTNWARLTSTSRDLVVIDVRPNGIVVEERWKVEVRGQPSPANRLTRIGGDSKSGPAYRPLLYSYDETGASFFIRNFPSKVVHGEKIGNPRVMRTGEARWNGKLIKSFDCGLPNTPENREKLKGP